MEEGNVRRSNHKLFYKGKLAESQIQISGTAWIIRNGLLLDPDSGLDLVKSDILVENGLITAIGVDLDVPGDDVEEVDASGLMVSAGWIDMHAHVYEHATVLGVNPDRDCLRRGQYNLAI